MSVTDAPAETETEPTQVETALKDVFQVSTRIARLLDLRRAIGDWTAAERAEVERLLCEEDRLREVLRVAGGPPWDSSRRWVD